MGTAEEANGKEAQADKSLHTKIIRQMEYYFGDHNLKRDKFLKEAITKDEGWVPFETLLTFNRLKSLSTDKDVIIEAVKNSPNELLEVSEDKLKIRRLPSKPIPSDVPEVNQKNDARSIYAKGFPPDSTLDEILEFFESHGSVENVYMRRFRGDDRKFKGSVFALFKTAEEAEKFINAKDVTFKSIPVLRETSKHYYERKAKESRKGKKKEMEEKSSADQSEKQAQDQKQPEVKKGCILHLDGFKAGVSREDIKEVFDDHAKVAWVDFSRGDKEAWVRFQEEETAAIALEKAKTANDGKLEVKDIEITARILEGDEETEYWNKIKDLMHKMKGRKGGQRGANTRGHRGGRGRGGRRDFGRNRKPRANDDKEDESNDKDDVKPKITKFESDSEETESKATDQVKPKVESEQLSGNKDSATVKVEMDCSDSKVPEKRKLEDDAKAKPLKVPKTEPTSA